MRRLLSLIVFLAGVVCAFAGNTWTSDGTQLNESISAGSFSTSLSYVITFVGSTNFMAIGAWRTRLACYSTPPEREAGRAQPPPASTTSSRQPTLATR